MKISRFGYARLWQIILGTIGLALLAACAAVSPASEAAPAQSSSASEQFSSTPATSTVDTPLLTSTLPSAITATISITEGAGLPVAGSKDNSQGLSNADSGVNQIFAEWLTTTGVSSAQLTPEQRSSSPTMTVTVIMEDEAAATNLKAALAQFEASLLAEATPMLSLQLPIGYLDQLAQWPGVLLIQMPSVAPPMSHAPNLATAIFASPQQKNAQQSNLFAGEQEIPALPGVAGSIEAVDAWANSIPIDWSGLENVEAEKQIHLSLADSSVNNAFQKWRATVQAAGSDLTQAAWSSEPLTVTLVMQDETAATTAKTLLPTFNAQLLDSYAEWLVIALPVGQIDALMQLPGLLLAQQPAQQPPLERSPMERSWRAASVASSQEATEPTAVHVVTQGVARSKINTWHAAGHRGKNVRVAIVDSFDQAIIDEAFAAKEIPTDVLNGPSEEGVYHGIAVAEVIYDMAPQATLSFHSIADAPDYCIAFANTLENLAKQKNQIISSSTGPTFCTTPGNGATSPLNQASFRVLDTYNTFYAQAAGNNALHHFERTFKGVSLDEDTVVNNFSATGEATINVLVVNTEDGPAPALIPAGSVLQFYLRWDGGWPRSAQDYDLYLLYYNGSTWSFLNCTPYPCDSENVQDGTQLPIERIETIVPFTGVYGLLIRKYDAGGNHFLDLLTSHAQPFLAHNSPSRSLVAAASYQYAFGVAAVDVSSLALENYSSRGPTYGPGNSPNGGFSQPQLAGFANVDTSVSDGFNGTSAATPHVAGAAAVLKSAAPCLSARQIGEWLKRYATDKGGAGFDFDYGAGILTFPALNKRPSCIPSVIYLPRLER